MFCLGNLAGCEWRRHVQPALWHCLQGLSRHVSVLTSKMGDPLLVSLWRTWSWIAHLCWSFIPTTVIYT